MIDEARALRAYTDVLAVEYDEDAGVMRIVTLSDVYHAVPTEGLHMCPDREYNDVDHCKHTVAAETTRGRIDAPTGWLVVDDLDARSEASPGETSAAGAITDGGESYGEYSYGDALEYVGPDDLEGNYRAPDNDRFGPYKFRHVTVGGTLALHTDYWANRYLAPEHPANDPAYWRRAVVGGDSDPDGERARADGGQLESGEWLVIDHDRDNRKTADSRADAEDKKATAREFGSENVEIVPPGGSPSDDSVEVVEHVQADPEPVDAEPVEAAADELPARGMNEDPLSILPGYMITEVQGTPTLNKRGISVLAYHYGVEVTDRDIVVSPHESDWEYAIVETEVENEDGRTFLGTGTAHVDRGDEREVLLELAETRSYKRAVSFATGTGIVSYQEMVSEVER